MKLHRTILAPSILAGNHALLAESAWAIESAELRWVHLDIMDGHFVPNITFGPQTVADLRRRCGLFFDTHLMLDEPHRYIDAFAQAGSSLISVHLEPDYPIEETLGRIRSLNCMNGIVLNPDTPAESALPFIETVDLVLLMTVQPGFGGQKFRGDVLEKIARFDRWRRDRSLPYRIEVDGGINRKTAPRCRERGCDTFVAGTAFFNSADPASFAADIENL